MSLNERDIDLFDRYTGGELTAVERRDFDNKLNTDPAFWERFNVYERSIDAVKTYSIGQEMGDIVSHHYKNRVRAAWMIAAAAVILFVSIPLLYFELSGPNTREVFQAYYEIYPADQNPRGENVTHSAMDLYRKGQYQQAIPLFEKMIKQNPRNQRLHLFLGSSYLEMDDFSKAGEHLTKAAQSDSRIIAQNGQWYLALTYLKSGNKDKATDQLKRIASGDHLFAEKSKEVLRELE